MSRSGGFPARSPAGESRRLPVWIGSGLVFGIRVYQATLSPLLGGACRFVPSCSRYAEEAVRAHGPWRGIVLGSRRLLRCRPGGGHGYDPVPTPRCGPAESVVPEADETGSGGSSRPEVFDAERLSPAPLSRSRPAPAGR